MKAEPRVLDPFVFRVDPAGYARLAAWWAEDEALFRKASRARRALAKDGLRLQERLRLESALAALTSPAAAAFSPPAEGGAAPTDAWWKAALDVLDLYGRFFREVKIQTGCTGRDLDARLRHDLKALLEQYHGIIRPAAVIRRAPCSFDGEGVMVEGMVEALRSRSLVRFYSTRLRKSEAEEYAAYEQEETERPLPRECVIFAATIGPGVDAEVARLVEGGEPYRGLLLNGIGAAAADLVGVDLECFLNAEAPAPQGRWRRFHVGYGDFRLEMQRPLFGFLEPGRIGLALTSACLMVPEKSVSGIMAVKMY